MQALRQVVRSSLRPLQASLTTVRCQSAAATNVILDTNDKTGVTTLKLNRKPVNSLNLEFLTELAITLEKLENEKSCKGVILTSANPGIFSAGLDIMEMYQPDEARLREFWRALQEFWLRLYGSRLPVIAAINGHSPAGGCLMAISCDYRIMADGKFTIGLNETLLGIVAPPWFQLAMERTIGIRQTERALQLGHNFSLAEALEVGLIDQVVPAEEVQATAEQEIAKWLKIPELARQFTKEQLRQPTMNTLIHRRQEDIDHFVNFITKAPVQKALGMYIEMLKKKSSAK